MVKKIFIFVKQYISIKRISINTAQLHTYLSSFHPSIQRIETLKPAATELLLTSKEVDVLDIIRFTFLDLVMKQVLLVQVASKKTHPRDPYFREVTTVRIGKNFDTYRADPFEQYFLNILKPDHYFYLHTYIRVIYKSLPSNYRCYQKVQYGSDCQNLFANNFLTKILQITRRNGKGNTLKKHLSHFLREVDLYIKDWMNTQPEKAITLIRFLEGNIFLLKNIPYKSIPDLKKVVASMGAKEKEAIGLDWLWEVADFSTTSLMEHLDEIFEKIDTHFQMDDGMDWGDFDADF